MQEGHKEIVEYRPEGKSPSHFSFRNDCGQTNVIALGIMYLHGVSY